MVSAILPIIKMAEEAKDTYVFIADIHTLNTIHDPQELSQHTREIAAAFLALELDLKKAKFFRQSDIPQVSVMNTLLANVTPKGLMNRAHAYKGKVQENIDEQRDPDDGVNMGLFTYPILMAADILLYGADVVPVGADQKQHVEIARDIGGSFNSTYKREILNVSGGCYIRGSKSNIRYRW